MRRYFAAGLALFLGGLLNVVLAQTDTATITGIVTDSTGALVPQAALEVTNAATGLRSRAQSNDTGSYKGDYGSASEYVRDLVRRDQQVRSQAKLEALLIEGIESGDPMPVTATYWEDLRRDLAKRRKKRGG